MENSQTSSQLFLETTPKKTILGSNKSTYVMLTSQPSTATTPKKMTLHSQQSTEFMLPSQPSTETPPKKRALESQQSTELMLPSQPSTETPLKKRALESQQSTGAMLPPLEAACQMTKRLETLTDLQEGNQNEMDTLLTTALNHVHKQETQDATGILEKVRRKNKANHAKTICRLHQVKVDFQVQSQTIHDLQHRDTFMHRENRDLAEKNKSLQTQFEKMKQYKEALEKDLGHVIEKEGIFQDDLDDEPVD